MATSPAEAGAAPRAKPKRSRRVPARRRWLYRGVVLLALIALVALCEGAFRLLGWGLTTERDDPYVGFSAVHPLFVRVGERYEIPESRQVYFRPQSFPAAKDERTFRIFCIGGSTVQGRPYAVESAFSTWLALDLKAADPARDWEVINCGGVSYAGYRLAPIVDELLGYEPDLLILYTGHNEFLEARTYDDVTATPPAAAEAHALLSRLRIYNAARSAWIDAARPDRSPKAELPAEVDATLDYQGGLDEYHRDDAWREAVVAHFEFNLRRMIAAANSKGVPVLLVDPPSNLRDCPPFKSEPSVELTAQPRARFDALWHEARDLGSERLERQCELLREALAIDGRHAAAHYYLAKCLEGLERFDEAKAEFLRARDEDICPLRIIGPLHAAIRRTAADTGTPLVDLRALFDRESRVGIPGDDLFLDHVHPTIDGHQLIAVALLESMAEQSLLAPREDWRERAKPLIRRQMGSLDAVYFERGRQRLDGLRRWAQGRALKIRPNPDERLLEPQQ
jgi:lysophospholipase L1-like esterase